jgi:hypothetical protein
MARIDKPDGVMWVSIGFKVPDIKIINKKGNF